MGLIGNYSVLAKHPGRDIGGGAIGLGNNRADFNKSSQMAGAFSGGEWSDQSARPVGYRPPYAWAMPRVAGGLSMRALGDGGLAADLIPSRPMTIDLTGAGDMEATAALAVSMLLAMTGGGDLTATIQGRLNASVDLTGSGDLAGSMSGFANMLVDLLGEGDLDATIAAFGDMSIDIVVTGTGLSTANVGQAVWAALAASNNGAGTMGAKLNAAASAGDPWSTDLPGAYAPGSAGDLLGNINATVRDSIWDAAAEDYEGAGTMGGLLNGAGNPWFVDFSDPLDFPADSAGALLLGVGQSVWSELAAANNDSGTMGAKLNDAGSASNPWTEVLETGFTAGELLLITAAAVAGKLDRVDNGDSTYTITIRGLADTKDRVIGIVDANGNRVSATYDGT